VGQQTTHSLHSLPLYPPGHQAHCLTVPFASLTLPVTHGHRAVRHPPPACTPAAQGAVAQRNLLPAFL